MSATGHSPESGRGRSDRSHDKLRAIYLTSMLVVAGVAGVSMVSGVGAAANVTSTTVANQSGGPDVDISSVTVRSQAAQNFVFARIADGTTANQLLDRDFSNAGATSDSQLWLNLTVSDFNPDVLMGTANVDSWEYSIDSNGDATVNISLQPASTERNFTAYNNMQAGPKPPGSSISWPESQEGADVSTGATVELGMINVSNQQLGDLDGARLNSDAQVYTFPSYDQSTGNLSIDIASPHCKASATGSPVATCSDSEQNTNGFYKAVVPQSFVNSRWGSDVSAEDLAGTYSSSSSGASNVQWTISERSDGSILIEASGISYSQGTVQIGESPSVSSGGSGSGSTPTTSARVRRTDGETEAVIDRVTLADPTVTVSVDDVSAGGFALRNVSATFDMGTTIDNLMPMSASETVPSGIPAAMPEEGVLGYVTIDIEGNLANRVTDGVFTLDFAGSDVDPSAVTAARYNGTAWEVVPSKVLNESVVEVRSPNGYSTFAISADQGETATPTATQTATATETATATSTVTATAIETDPGTVAVQTNTAPPDTQTPGSAGPGFGVLLTLVALLLVSAAHRRQR